jgi:hypothetical protein
VDAAGCAILFWRDQPDATALRPRAVQAWFARAFFAFSVASLGPLAVRHSKVRAAQTP